MSIVDFDAPQFGSRVDRSIDIAEFLQLLEPAQIFVRADGGFDAGDEPGLGIGLDVGAHGELARDETDGEKDDHEDCGAEEFLVHAGIIGAAHGSV